MPKITLYLDKVSESIVLSCPSNFSLSQIVFGLLKDSLENNTWDDLALKYPSKISSRSRKHAL